MPPKSSKSVTNLLELAASSSKKKKREEVETPSSAPAHQLQKKDKSNWDGTSLSCRARMSVGPLAWSHKFKTARESESRMSRAERKKLSRPTVLLRMVWTNPLLLQLNEGIRGEYEVLLDQISQRYEAKLAETVSQVVELKQQLGQIIPAMGSRVQAVEQKVLKDELASQASIQEIKELQAEMAQQRNMVAAEHHQQEAMGQQQEAVIKNQGQFNNEVERVVTDMQARIEKLMKANQWLKDKVDVLEAEKAQGAGLVTGVLGDGRLNPGAMHPNSSRASVNSGDAAGGIGLPPTNPGRRRSSARMQSSNEPVMANLGLGEVEMEDAYPPEYDGVVPVFDGKNIDVKSFTFRCRKRYNRYEGYYIKNPRDMVMFIVDHLTGEAERWYRMDEIYNQDEFPDPEELLLKLEEEFRNERNRDDVKTMMLKLRHEWGNAYEYLVEFNRLSRMLNLSEEVKKLVLFWQVKPSVKEAFYDLPNQEQNLRGFVACLKRCDSFPESYRIDELEKNDVPLNRTLSLMGLLVMMDPMRPSKVLEIKKRRKDNYRRDRGKDKERNKESSYDKYAGRKEEGKHKYEENKRNSDYHERRYDDRKDERDGGKRKDSYWKDRRSSSNNPIPKNYAIVDDKESEYQPKAEVERRDGTVHM